jgi:hypothetical protein
MCHDHLPPAAGVWVTGTPSTATPLPELQDLLQAAIE